MPPWEAGSESVKRGEGLRTFGLVVNRHLAAPVVRPVVEEMLARLDPAGVRLVMLGNGADLALPVEAATDAERVEMVIALGGDGTVLSAARWAAPREVPVLGIRMGRLGFLSEVEPSGISTALGKCLCGDYVLEPRAMLEAAIIRETGRVEAGVALNDLVITKGTLLRPVSTEVRVNDEPVASFLGDGVILATPTGSTAYSLSAGGPILTPDVQGIIITPLCAHSIVARTVVVGPNNVVRVTLLSARKGAILVLDGQESHNLAHGEAVVARQAARPALLIRLRPWSFFEVLRERLEKRGS